MKNKKNKRLENWPISFEVDKAFLNFHCEHGVFPKPKQSEGSGCSVCYCTDKKRANLIANALTFYCLKNRKAFESDLQ